MKQSVAIAGGAILAVAGLLLVPYKNLNKIQAVLFGGATVAGFIAGSKGRQLEQDQEAFDLQISEAKEHQKMLAQSSLEVLQMEEVAIETARAQANIEYRSLEHQKHLQVLKEIQFPGLLEAEIEEARRRSESSNSGDRQQTLALDRSHATDGSHATESGTEIPISQTPDKGQRLLQKLRKSDMSILVVGSTGAGKSHTLSAYLEFLYKDFPDADVWVISRKNDSFCGLREAGRVVRFNSLDPVKALDKLREIHAIFQARTEALEDERPKLSTIRLVLEDWSSICLILKKNKVIWDEVQIILSDIVTVGRELNVALFILAQSANLESLGLVGDANLRTCLAIVAQGLESINNKGEKQGDYNLIQLVLKNVYIIPSDEDRKLLTSELANLIVESRNLKQPVFLCTGGEAFVGLLPRITKANLPVGRQGDRAIQQSDSIACIDTQRQQLDALFERSNIAEQLRNEMTSQEIDELIKGLRNGNTTRIDVSDTPSILNDVSDTYQEAEALPDKGLSRIWDVSDFDRYLPDRDELVLFEQLLAYQDTSRSGSEIIKKAWGFSSGEAYREKGQPCFVYIVNKHGTEAQKKFYASYIEKCLRE